jgi:hypothetical protein
MPRHNHYRPDFLAPGPHVAVQKDKLLSFDDRPEDNDGYGDDDDDDDDDFSRHRFYQSDKILGKLYRSIDEREVFSGIQQQGLSQHVNKANRARHSVSSVLEGVWTYVQRRCQAIQWEHHLDRARGIRDEYVSSVLSHLVA